MPTPAPDRQRVSLIAIAVISLALSTLAVRVVSGAAAVAAKPVPAADLQALGAFMAPLASAPSLADVGAGTMVGDRDPFGSVAPVPGAFAAGSSPQLSRPRTDGVQPWVVSSILFEDNKRSAIVNNAWVGVGDPLGGGARVTAIERKYVIVTDANGNRHVVSIQDGAL
jgi:hypothetical protein